MKGQKFQKIATILYSKFVLLPIKSNALVVYQKQKQGSLIKVMARKSEKLVKHVCSFNRSSHYSTEVAIIKSY